MLHPHMAEGEEQSEKRSLTLSSQATLLPHSFLRQGHRPLHEGRAQTLKFPLPPPALNTVAQRIEFPTHRLYWEMWTCGHSSVWGICSTCMFILLAETSSMGQVVASSHAGDIVVNHFVAQ